MLRKIVFYSMIIFLVDQLVKLIVRFNMMLNSSFAVIDNFFYITYVHNYGAAFSIFNGNRFFLISVTFVAILIIYHFLIKGKCLNKYDIFFFSLLYGGILGNLYDRIFYGYVIDFFDFYIFNYNFAIFNIADMCIVISMILILFDVIRGDKNEDSSRN